MVGHFLQDLVPEGLRMSKRYFAFFMKFFNPWDKNFNNMTISEAELLQLRALYSKDNEC